jgi:hypothetical protein
MPRVPMTGYGQQHVPYQQQQQHQPQHHHSQYPHAYTPSAPPVAMYSNYPPPVQQQHHPQTHPNARAHVSTHPGAIPRGHVRTGSGAHSPPMSIPPAAAAPPMPFAMQIAATMPAVGPPPGILGFVLFAAPLALSTAIIAALTLL